MGHLILLGLLLVIIFMNYRREGLDNIINPTYDKYMADVRARAAAGQLYGCDSQDSYAPYSLDECQNQIEKAALFGCTPV